MKKDFFIKKYYRGALPSFRDIEEKMRYIRERLKEIGPISKRSCDGTIWLEIDEYFKMYPKTRTINGKVEKVEKGNPTIVESDIITDV